MNRPFKSFVVASLFGLALMQVAFAQTIPQAELDTQKAECKAECAQSGNGDLVCETLCACTVKHFGAELSYPQYNALKAELDRNELSLDNSAFLERVSAACVAELNQLLKQLGIQN